MTLIKQKDKVGEIRPIYIGIRKICVYSSKISKVSATALLISLSKKAIANKK